MNFMLEFQLFWSIVIQQIDKNLRINYFWSAQHLKTYHQSQFALISFVYVEFFSTPFWSSKTKCMRKWKILNNFQFLKIYSFFLGNWIVCCFFVMAEIYLCIFYDIQKIFGMKTKSIWNCWQRALNISSLIGFIFMLLLDNTLTCNSSIFLKSTSY